jgi:hypothetical protein
MAAPGLQAWWEIVMNSLSHFPYDSKDKLMEQFYFLVFL